MFTEYLVTFGYIVSGGSGDIAVCILLRMIIEESFGSGLATICSHYTKIVHPLFIHSCSPSSLFSRLADFFAASMKESTLGTAWDEANMQQPCR